MTNCIKVSFCLMEDVHKSYYFHYYYLVTCLTINFYILVQKGHYFVVGAEVVQEFAEVVYSSSCSYKAGETYAYFLSYLESPWIGQTLIHLCHWVTHAFQCCSKHLSWGFQTFSQVSTKHSVFSCLFKNYCISLCGW